MKKILLFPAVIALAALCFLSCNKSNNDGKKTDVVMQEPTYKQDAQAIKFTQVSAADQQLIPVDQVKLQPEKVIFTESGRFVFVGIVQELTKAKVKTQIGDYYTVTGKFTRDKSGKYTLPRVGTISLIGGTRSQLEVIIVSESGQSYNFSADALEPAPTTNTMENNMARTWKPEGKMKISIPSLNISTNLEPSLKAIAQYLEEHEIELSVDLAEYEGWDVADISLSMVDNSIIIAFQNGQAYVGQWSWTDVLKGTFNYTFSANLSGEIFNGSATGSIQPYQEDNVNKCSFELNINVDNKTASLKFTFREV